MRGKTPVSDELPDEHYFALIDQLHAYDARFSDLVPTLNAFLVENTLVHDHVLHAWTAITGYVGGLPWIGTATAATPDRSSLPPLSAEQALSCTVASGVQPVAAATAYVANSDVGKRLASYGMIAQDVLCTQGIRFTPSNLPPYVPFLENMRQWSVALGLWYLPALYGALGVTLFYMRRVLDPTVPDPPLIRVVHRLALGAFAGVIVTWFWAPNRELAEGFTSIGLTLLTLAFLIGFSVDVLFALLDRLVRVLMDIAKGGPPPSGPVAVPAVVLQTSATTGKDQKDTGKDSTAGRGSDRPANNAVVPTTQTKPATG